MSLILVFTATKMEGAIVERLMRNKTHSAGSNITASGRIGENQIVLATTGMGPANARAVASRLLQSPKLSRERLSDTLPAPDAALITGLAGSLVPWLGDGDIVIYDNCLSEIDQQMSVPCSPHLIQSMARHLGSRGLHSKNVAGISSPRIAQRDRDRERLAGSGAAVVDMESFQVAACSAAAQVPVAVMRAISDSPGSRMPDLNRALTPAGDFDPWILTRLLVSSPLATARLFRASRRALAALDQALDAVLSHAPFLGDLIHVQPLHAAGQSPAGFDVLTSKPSNTPTCDRGLSRVQE